MSLAFRVRTLGLSATLWLTAGGVMAACSSSAEHASVDAATSAACASGDSLCAGSTGGHFDARVPDRNTDKGALDAGAIVVLQDASFGDDGPDGQGYANDVFDAGPLTSQLPCDVATVLAPCAECHGDPPRYGAPMPLRSWDDLVAQAKTDPSKLVYQRLLERVADDAMPMPPAPRERLSTSQLATLQQWVAAGAPAATTATACDSQVTPPDAEVDAGAPSTYTPPVYFPKPDDCESTFEIKAHGATGVDDQTKFTVAGTPTLQNNEYHCFYYSPPFGSDQSVLWYEPILDNLAHVHHWILYTTENATHASGTSAPCNATQPGASYVAIWAPGANNTSIPSDVGLQLPTGPKAGLILELHYYNDSGAPQQDASGIRFCTGAASKRPHTAATHQTGTEGICLQPGASSVTGHCGPRTDLGASHIRGIWPHMHKLGRRMVVTVNRLGGAAEVIHDQQFDFSSQVFYPKDIVLNPGDTLDTACYYSNDSNSQVHFGERTQDEMCYGFIMAWPPDSLASPPPLFGNLLGATGPEHRCVDGNSITRSCNGYADLPSTPATE